jgi:hypothetical protein
VVMMSFILWDRTPFSPCMLVTTRHYTRIKVKKIKISLLQAVEEHRVARS